MNAEPDPERWYNTTLNLWQLAGVLVAVVTVVKWIPAVWRLTLGRRRHLIAQLRKIAPGVRHDYVEGLLGEPKWQSTMTCTRLADPDAESTKAAKGGFWRAKAKEVEKDDRDVEITVRTWPLSRLGYLVTWSEKDAVVMYGITTTSWWFRPRVLVGNARIRLGKSILADLDRTEEHRAWQGNRRYGYLEEHFFGNPGGYRRWYVGVNDIGYQPVPPMLDWNDSETELNRMPDEKRNGYRARTPINTVVISGTALYEELQKGEFFGMSLGVDQDMVRLSDPSYRVFDSRFTRVRLHVRDWRWERRRNRLDKQAAERLG
ncbi:ETEC_3214 domain-containing protein [Streptomyces goshikiensis]|uniref:ETEC_3214 domain-containing protein n=1 Tax=Streptomyces goshikiensis TaxID=1942 RepID=UPI0036B36C68